MMRSMTAYGRKEKELAGGVMTCEIRSVNHRYLELGLRLPDELRAVEPKMRELIGRKLKRGKVDVGIRYQPAATTAGGLSIDRELARQVMDAARDISALGDDPATIDPLRILAWPGVVMTPVEDTDSLRADSLSLVSETLDDFIAAREREGEKTRGMLTERIDGIEKIVGDVRKLRPAVNLRLKEKLVTRLAEIDLVADQSRLEQELVYAAHKLDVDEELDRLEAHISEARDIFQRSEPVGRRLDFLIQEFNREANTLSSKSADSDTTGFSVDLKVLIEQMREQVQNIE